MSDKYKTVTLEELLKSIFGNDAVPEPDEKEHPEDCLCGLNFDDDGWSESLPLTEDNIKLLNDYDLIRFNAKKYFKVYSKKEILDKKLYDEYFAFQVKQRESELEYEPEHEPAYYFLIPNKQDDEVPAIIWLGKFATPELANQQADIAYPEVDGIIVSYDFFAESKKIMEDMIVKSMR